MSAYVGAADSLRSQDTCAQVGLLLGGDDWEYPLWPLLKGINPAVRIEHVNVTNSSAVLSKPFAPCYVISTVRTDDQRIVVAGAPYERVWPLGKSAKASVYRAIRSAGATGPDDRCSPLRDKDV